MEKSEINFEEKKHRNLRVRIYLGTCKLQINIFNVLRWAFQVPLKAFYAVIMWDGKVLGKSLATNWQTLLPS